MRLGLFETLPMTSIGVHDVVFYLGVLYHVENPFATVRKLAEATGELAVIETLEIPCRGSLIFQASDFWQGRSEPGSEHAMGAI